MPCMCDVCGEELVAASKQFRRSRGEKSTRLGLLALTVGPVHIRMRAIKKRASEGSVCWRAIAAACNQFRISRGEKSTRLGLVALTVRPVHISFSKNLLFKNFRQTFVILYNFDVKDV